MSLINIGLDIAGGDFAPDCNFEGIELAVKNLSPDIRLTLIGDERVIKEKLAAKGLDENLFSIVHAPEIIDMGESPLKAVIAKPNSSIAVGLKLLKSGQIDGFASAGNTGAIFGASVITLGTVIENIRPCLMTLVPKSNGSYGVLLDIGASADSKPENLYQFAVLGNSFAKFILGNPNPKIGLINIGEEPEKGNELVKATYKLMVDSSDFNFIGNVEGTEFFSPKADVLVCNGFTGNIVVKLCEAWYKVCRKSGLNNDYIEQFNYENQGGSPVLGVNGSVVIGHGISNGKAIMNMIKLTSEIVQNKLSAKIKEALSSNE